MSQKLGQLSSSRGLNSLSSFEEAILRDGCQAIFVPACDIDKIKALTLIYNIDKDFVYQYCHPRRMNINMRAMSQIEINIGLDHRLMGDMTASINSTMKYTKIITKGSVIIIGVTDDMDLIKSSPVVEPAKFVYTKILDEHEYDEPMYSYTYNPYDTKFTL